MSLIGFARVSTTDQDLTPQVDRLVGEGCSKVFQSKHSGKAESNEKALSELLDYVRDGDTVLVTKLDRLGRSLSQVLQTIDLMKSRGVSLRALDQPVDTSKNDPMSMAMVQLLGMFSEMERSFITTRMMEGKQHSGNYGGRPTKLSEAQIQEIKAKYKAGQSKLSLSKQYGVSRATIMRYVE
ncbi:recombinase family protein [Oceanobacter mangrovi]|uniref:recombinase family protein n=1 Tax=Oceanobacter mangrovi TaxID=2862510 RepID=UPI001C8DCC24|nr:recombinase family protein [Oceanobacter mangrovi]